MKRALDIYTLSRMKMRYFGFFDNRLDEDFSGSQRNISVKIYLKTRIVHLPFPQWILVLLLPSKELEDFLAEAKQKSVGCNFSGPSVK